MVPQQYARAGEREEPQPYLFLQQLSDLMSAAQSTRAYYSILKNNFLTY
jgi:hypothetical protein